MKDKKNKREKSNKKEAKNRYELRMQMLIKLMQEKAYVPMKEKELAVFLQVGKRDRNVFMLECENRLAV